MVPLGVVPFRSYQAPSPGTWKCRSSVAWKATEGNLVRMIPGHPPVTSLIFGRELKMCWITEMIHCNIFFLTLLVDVIFDLLQENG